MPTISNAYAMNAMPVSRRWRRKGSITIFEGRIGSSIESKITPAKPRDFLKLKNYLSRIKQARPPIDSIVI